MDLGGPVRPEGVLADHRRACWVLGRGLRCFECAGELLWDGSASSSIVSLDRARGGSCGCCSSLAEEGRARWWSRKSAVTVSWRPCGGRASEAMAVQKKEWTMQRCVGVRIKENIYTKDKFQDERELTGASRLRRHNHEPAGAMPSTAKGKQPVAIIQIVEKSYSLCHMARSTLDGQGKLVQPSLHARSTHTFMAHDIKGWQWYCTIGLNKARKTTELTVPCKNETLCTSLRCEQLIRGSTDSSL